MPLTDARRLHPLHDQIWVMADERTTNKKPLQPGMVVGGNYVLRRRLGEGVRGEVFEAEDTSSGDHVALKVLTRLECRSPEAGRRIPSEVEAIARLEHPNLAMLYELGRRSNGTFYIAEELLIGRSLRELLREKERLGLGETLEILVPIMAALVAAHSKGVIHRNIKPENIIITPVAGGAAVPKLVDFTPASLVIGHTNAVALAPSTTMATPMPMAVRYVPPELLRDEGGDERMDIWSIGAVMFEMLAGRSPFDDPSVAQVIFNICEGRAPRIDAIVPAVPGEVGEVLQRSLAREPAQRHDSMRDLLRAIIEIAVQQDRTFESRHAGLMAGMEVKQTLSPAGLRSGRVPIEYREPGADRFGQETFFSTMPPRPFTAEHFDDKRRSGAGIEINDSVEDTLDLPKIDDTSVPLAPRGAAPERSDATATALKDFVGAAKQALRLNALQEAMTHAEMAIIRFQAKESTRGQMRLVQTIACRWLGDFGEAERYAEEAMQYLERGTSEWFSAVVHHGAVSGYLGKKDRVKGLARELLDLKVWRDDHYVETLCYLIIEVIRSGAIELAQELFSRASLRKTPDAGHAKLAALDLAQAELALHAGDPVTHLRRLEMALIHFGEMRDARNACLQRASLGNAYMQLGAYARAEKLQREALLEGEQMKLWFVGPLRSSLGLTLARLGDLDQALSVVQAALDECVRLKSPRLVAIARIYLSEILSLRGDVVGAKDEARKAIELAASFPAIRAYAAARRAEILLQREQALQAFDHAKTAMDTLEQLDSVEEGEALIRIVYVMALDATDRPRTAAERLAGARQRLLERAERITDPDLRKSFLENVPENALTLSYTLRGEKKPPPR